MSPLPNLKMNTHFSYWYSTSTVQYSFKLVQYIIML